MITFYGAESPFSNFYPCNIEHARLIFPSSEHLFMWRKAMFFGDEIQAAKILVQPTPGLAKKEGRKVSPFDDPKWSSVKDSVMYDTVLAKFIQNLNERRMLISTGNEVLVEASPRDTYWGVGKDAAALELDPTFNGKNQLGNILMRVRGQLSR